MNDSYAHTNTHTHTDFVICTAYTYVGYFIFGHQYGGMQTFDKALSTIFFIMCVCVCVFMCVCVCVS